MKRSPYNNPKRECDYVPAMELVGIWAANATVCKMLTEGKLEAGQACLLNSALALHSFNVWHCCSHEALAAHNEEHEPFENMVTRLSALLVRFPDSNVAGHKRHHRYTNTPDDPDMYMQMPLEQLGEILLQSFQSGELTPGDGGAYEDHALDMVAQMSLKILCDHEETSKLGQTLLTALNGSSKVFMVILILFFGRYPHLQGRSVTGTDSNEIDSFYNTTWRGQGQVDLWMMGEGWHHGHHAVTDVNYTVLPKVGADVEASYPHLKVAFRGNDDVLSLEQPGSGLPPNLSPDTSEPCQRGWERTKLVRAEIEKLLSAGGSPDSMQGFVSALAGSAIDNALHVVTTADCSLLRHLHDKLGFKGAEDEPGSLLPISKWHETVFSARAQELLREQAVRIKAEVLAVGAAAGAAFAPSARISQKSDLKGCYLEFFKALGSVLVEPAKFWKHLEEVAGAFPAPQQGGGGEEELLARVRRYLESPLPRNSLRPADLMRPKGSKEGADQLVATVLGLRPPASRL